MRKNLSIKFITALLAVAAGVCSACFISSCGDDEITYSKIIINGIIDAEKKSFTAEEYRINYQLSMQINTEGYFGNYSTAFTYGEIGEGDGKVQFCSTENGERIYRTGGFDFTYNYFYYNEGTLEKVERSGDKQIAVRPEPDKPEDLYGLEITREKIDDYNDTYLYTTRVGKKELLNQFDKIQTDGDGVGEFDLSDIEFGDDLIIKHYVNKDEYLFLTEADNLKVTVDVEGVKVDATIRMAMYYYTYADTVFVTEAGRCVEYADYYTDEDKVVRNIENYQTPVKVPLYSDICHVKEYKIDNYGKETGILAGDATGKIAAASPDELGLFSYVDIYDRDMNKIQTVRLRGTVKAVDINKNYLSVNLTYKKFDGKYGLTSVVLNLDDGRVISQKELDEREKYYAAVLFGDAFVDSGSATEDLTIYNIAQDKHITPFFDGKPIKGSALANADGNILVSSYTEDGTYLFEIDDSGKVIASRKKISQTFGGSFIGKYWAGSNYETGEKIYYNAQEEITDIDIGEYVGNGKPQLLYVDDSYAVILDSLSGCFVYDFKSGEYVLKADDWQFGIIVLHFYLGSGSWLISYNYSDSIRIFGV